MKIIISPAKKLTARKISIINASEIQFSDEAKYLVDQLRDYKVSDIRQLMDLSDDLAKLNYERYQRWDLESNDVNPAIYMFQGDVYKALKTDQLSKDDLEFAQENLRIISGLYGIIRPLDLVFPYRLEMGVKMKTNKGNDLYKFWGDKLRNSLSSQMKDNEIVVNLASNEYSKALRLDSINQPVVTPVFKDYKNGNLKVISFYAKKARGEMTNFIIKNRIACHIDLKLFTNEGYSFAEEQDGEMLFCR